MRADLENLSARSLWVLSTIHKYLVEHEHLLAVKIEHVFGAVQSMEAVSDITPIVKKLVEGAYLQAEKGGLVFTLKGLIAVGATPSREPPSCVSVEFLLLIALADRFTRLLEESYDVLFIEPLAVALELELTQSSEWVEKVVKNYESGKLLVTSVGKDSSNLPITLVSLTGIGIYLAGIRKRQLLDGRLDFYTQASPRDEDATLNIAATDDGRRTGSITSDQGREGSVQLGIDPTMPQGDPETMMSAGAELVARSGLSGVAASVHLRALSVSGSTAVRNASVVSAGTTPTFVGSDLDPGSSVEAVSIPAADRFVTRSDNAPLFERAEQELEALTEAVRAANDLRVTADQRMAIIREVEGIHDLVRQSAVRARAIYDAVRENSLLKWLAVAAGAGVVGEKATAAVNALLALLRL
jgi:hypothetical protein